MIFNKKNKEKIFCIGFNKTGTTTIEKSLKELGYNMGDQFKGEMLVFDWFKRDFKEIINLCKTADAFQDVPFSLPFSYVFLDNYFKNAKFILTERDSPEQWYNSITKFHSKIWGDGENPPNKEQMLNATYRYKGYPYESFKLIYNTNDDDLYNFDKLLKAYTTHIYLVKEYFRSRPEKLLVINVSKKNDYKRLCDFLNKQPLRDNFPWENKTSEK